MLFLINYGGVPSNASFVQFSAPVLELWRRAAIGLTGQGAIGSATLTVDCLPRPVTARRGSIRIARSAKPWQSTAVRL